MTTGAERGRIALERLESDDPRGHAFHLLLAMTWCVLSGIGTTPEGAAWGALVAIAVLRLPHSWRTYRHAISDPVWILLGAWWLWGLLSLTWAVPGVDLAEGLKPLRWLLTPLLLWPVAGRAALLLTCLGIGVLVQVAATLLLSWGPDGLARYSEMRGLASFGDLSWDLTTALVLSAAAFRFAQWPHRLATLPPLAASALAVAHAGFRFSLGGGAAATAVLTLRPRGRRGDAGRWLLPAVLLATGGVFIASGGLTAWQRTSAEIDAIEHRSPEQAMMSTGSRRAGMAIASLELIGERPWLGGGRASYRPLITAWAEDKARESPSKGYTYRFVAETSHPHNIYLLSWVEGGVVSVLLVAGGLWMLAVRLWRRSGREATMAATLAVFSLVLVGSLVSTIEWRIPGGLIALCMAISRNPCSMPSEEVDVA